MAPFEKIKVGIFSYTVCKVIASSEKQLLKTDFTFIFNKLKTNFIFTKHFSQQQGGQNATFEKTDGSYWPIDLRAH